MTLQIDRRVCFVEFRRYLVYEQLIRVNNGRNSGLDLTYLAVLVAELWTPSALSISRKLRN